MAIKRLKKFAVALLLGVGIPIMILAIAKLPDSNLPPGDRTEVIAALIFLGAVPTATAGYLLWDLRQQSLKARSDHLHSIFFKLLKVGHGKLTVLDFAMHTRLPGLEAKAFLDDRAREFTADFSVSESGGLLYHFPVSEASLRYLNAASESTYDVILEAFPLNRKRQVRRILKELTGLSWREIKAMIQKIPAPLAEGVTKTRAEVFRSKLEAIGATITLVLN